MIMPAAARLGDPIADGDTVATGSGNVFFNGLPVARIGDMSAGHGCFPPTALVQGSPTVFANNIAISRVGDQHAAHSCSSTTHSGGQRAVAVGSPDVFINS
jgi:uncharacterized Zn-binding protein involved in type VI secretion